MAASRPKRSWSVLLACVCMLVCAPAAAAAAPAFTQAPGSPYNIDASVIPVDATYSPSGDLLAVTNSYENTNGVAMFSVNRATGALTEDGSITPALAAYALAFSPSGDLLAVLEGDQVVVYSVDQQTGALTAWTPASTVCGPSTPGEVAFNPSGNTLAVVENCGDYHSSVLIFTVDRTDETLTQAGSIATQAYCPTSLAYNSGGTVLAVSSGCNDSTDGVQTFSVSTAGTLESLQSTSTGTGSCPQGISFSGDALLAVPLTCGSTVELFNVNTSTGAMTKVSTTDSGDCPSDSQFSSNGDLLELVDQCSDTMYVLSVANGGAELTNVSGSPYDVGFAPSTSAFSPGGGEIALPQLSADIGGVAVYTLAPPTPTIASPGTNRVFTLGQQVSTSFACTEALDGPGITSCTDSNSSSGSSGKLNTSTLGAHTYTVTATSQDGLSSQASISYTVVGAPAASITTPGSGKRYPVGKRVSTSFACSEGAGGPGLAACVDSNGSTSGHGTLNTTTPGRHVYTVTAFSEDGTRATVTITYTVAAKPTVTISAPKKGVKYTVGQKVKVRFKCQDGVGGTGIAKCKGTVKNGRALPTGKSGKYKFTVKATSKDGLTASYTVTYSVVRR